MWCLFELGVSFAIINYICLSFVQIHTVFYFNYIICYGLLIFCCQYVAINIYYPDSPRYPDFKRGIYPPLKSTSLSPY